MSRDYDKELEDSTGEAFEKYAYQFDYEVMHPFMLRKLKEFRGGGKVLEVGSHFGIFTEKILEQFNDVTCVEISRAAFVELESRIGTRAKLFNAPLEEIQDLGLSDIIILTHVLEHVDDPLQILRQIKSLLSPGGIAFVVVPSATAASRQIAVEMGLISHLTAVTEAERLHGHQRTYTLDTLKRDARDSGLKVLASGGIFFKGLANFQFDLAIPAGIVGKDYLEACYSLGDKYPELCASLYFVGTLGEPQLDGLT
jgi:2-polyprenyl-3-methyl-5-hydroxy-6-metoxy-1,4-benzoquinol methylase